MKNKDIFIKEIVNCNNENNKSIVLNILNTKYGGTKALLLSNKLFTGDIEELSNDILYEIASCLNMNVNKYFENCDENIIKGQLRTAIKNLNEKYKNGS